MVTFDFPAHDNENEQVNLCYTMHLLGHTNKSEIDWIFRWVFQYRYSHRCDSLSRKETVKHCKKKTKVKFIHKLPCEIFVNRLIHRCSRKH